jgi:hypothetical protein
MTQLRLKLEHIIIYYKRLYMLLYYVKTVVLHNKHQGLFKC